MLTGESLPVTKQPGGAVFGATVNTIGALHMEATKVGGDTALAQIVRLVAEAQTTRLRCSGSLIGFPPFLSRSCL